MRKKGWSGGWREKQRCGWGAVVAEEDERAQLILLKGNPEGKERRSSQVK